MEEAAKKKILIVDDDRDMVSVLKDVLEFEGYEVESAPDGEKAFVQLRKSTPGLIVADIALPNMNGWKLCRKIRENPSTKDIPILVLSAKMDEVDELRAYESGADYYLAKPFNNERFVELVAGLMVKRRKKL